jgi:hypothetical protein
MNKRVCKKCIKEMLKKSFCRSGVWTPADMEKEIPNLDFQYNEWFKIMLSNYDRRVPCPIKGSECQVDSFPPLQMDIMFTLRLKPPDKCSYLLEHTVS